MLYGLFPLFYVCVIKRLSSQYTSLFDIEKKYKSIPVIFSRNFLSLKTCSNEVAELGVRLIAECAL